MAETKAYLVITDDNFEQVVTKSDKPVLVDFWAEWCGPCLALAPTIEEMAKEYAGRAVIGKMDVDANQARPLEFQIRSIPTLLFFKNGQVVDKAIGLTSKEALKKKLDSLL